jgi:hypothetical protein
MSNPLDEYLEKRAFFGGLGRAVKSFAQGAAGQGTRKNVVQQFGMAGRDALKKGISEAGSGAMQATGIAAVGLGLAAVNKMVGARQVKQDFREMMDLHPDLAQAQAQDPKRFNAAYKGLRQLNPTYAGNPLVAGTMMQRMMDNPEGAGAVLAGSFKQPDAPRPGSGFGASFGMSGGGAQFKQTF